MRQWKWREAGVLALLLAANYGLNTIAFRMVARGSYVGVAISDSLIAWWGFAMVKRIHQADTKLEKFGYILGGVIGSLLGLRLTK